MKGGDLPVLNMLKVHLDRLLEEKERIIVAIDGSCTAGKTTLAARLQRHCGGEVIPMDDFFLRPEQRTPERFAQPGGNVDHERFCQEVLRPLLAGESFAYRPYDCKTCRLSEPREVVPGRLTIVEGTYSLHPAFGECYDLKVFLEVDEETRRRRILQRPPALHRRFFEEWIPMEQLYFSRCAVAERCDLVLTLPLIEE